MLEFSELNWWAIITATALAFVLGGLWYGPLLPGPKRTLTRTNACISITFVYHARRLALLREAGVRVLKLVLEGTTPQRDCDKWPR